MRASSIQPGGDGEGVTGGDGGAVGMGDGHKKARPLGPGYFGQFPDPNGEWILYCREPVSANCCVTWLDCDAEGGLTLFVK